MVHAMGHGLKFLVVATIIAAAFGCAPDSVFDEVEEYTTINGHYDLRIFETENTCYGMKDSLDHVFEMRVVVQEEGLDGSYVVDIMIDKMSWVDAIVKPDGSFEAVLDWWDMGVELDTISGTVGSNEEGDVILNATLTLDLINICYAQYELEGYQLYTPNEPPEDF